jgi:hypothetical protein
MSSKMISVELDPANWLWLQDRASATSDRSLSKILNEILAQVRKGDGSSPVRSVRGTIRLPEADPDLDEAREHVRELFRQSTERSGRRLSEVEGTGA